MPASVPDDWLPPDGFRHPCWEAYRSLLRQLPRDRFARPEDLNRLLPGALRSRGGARIRFVPDDGSKELPYERRIHETGEVPTRPANWHDLFNGLAWCRLPQTKIAMNALHLRAMGPDPSAPRGPLRDAVTLLDESGVAVFSRDSGLLAAIANGCWTQAFVTKRGAWGVDTRVVVCGHALLEKFLQPYKSITAQALLFRLPDGANGLPGHFELDQLLAWQLRAGCLDAGPAALTPLPLAGIPGWWEGGCQDSDFYADTRVFRPRRSGRAPAPVLSLNAVNLRCYT
jgi:hypothetical protein